MARRGRFLPTLMYFIILIYTAWWFMIAMDYLEYPPGIFMVFGVRSLEIYAGILYMLSAVLFLKRILRGSEPVMAEAVFRMGDSRTEKRFLSYFEYTTNVLPAYYSTTVIKLNENIFLKLRIPLVAMCSDCSCDCTDADEIVLFPSCDIRRKNFREIKENDGAASSPHDNLKGESEEISISKKASPV